MAQAGLRSPLVFSDQLWRALLQVQDQAQFHAVHLLRVMVKLRPEWLPKSLFEALQERWASQLRLGR